MVKPHIRIAVFGNVPMWRVVWPEGQDRDSSPANRAAAWYVLAKNVQRMPEGFGRAWRAANPGVCDCMMPLPVVLLCSQEPGPHRRPTLPLRNGAKR